MRDVLLHLTAYIAQVARSYCFELKRQQSLPDEGVSVYEGVAMNPVKDELGMGDDPEV